MSWSLSILGCLIAAPCALAVAERWRRPARGYDAAFWALAHRIGGRCTARWGAPGWPEIFFELPVGHGRVGIRHNRWSGYTVEVFCRLPAPFGFAARMTAPPASTSPLDVPDMREVEPLFAQTDDDEITRDTIVPGASVRANDQALARWLLREGDVWETLAGLRAASGARQVECLLAGRAVVVRAVAAPRLGPGDVAELVVPSLAEAAGCLVEAAVRLTRALEDAGDAVPYGEALCPACARVTGASSWRCSRCGGRLHPACASSVGDCPCPLEARALDADGADGLRELVRNSLTREASVAAPAAGREMCDQPD